MTDQKVDSLMRQVLMDAIELKASTESASEISFVPSARYRRQICAMLTDPQEWARKRARPVWRQVLQRVAIIFFTISLTFGGLMAASPTVRAAVARWVEEWYETHIIYRYSGKQITDEMPQYVISDLPEGYVEVESKRVEWPEYVSFTYYDPDKENDQGIIFDYAYMSQGGAADFETENAEVLSVTVNGLDGQLFLAEDWENTRSTLTWIDSENNIQFTLMAALGENDILHIAESIYLVEMPK